MLGKLGRRDEGLQAFGASCDMFRSGPPTRNWRKQVARALVKKSDVLGDLGRFAEAVFAAQQAVERFGVATDSALHASRC